MLKISSIAIMIFLVSTLGFAQETQQKSTQEITLTSSFFFGSQLKQAGAVISMNDVIGLSQSNKQAQQALKSAKTNAILGSVVSGVGGFMIGSMLGTMLGGGDANWTLAMIGSGLIVASIPITIYSNSKAKTGVRLYNEGLKNSSFWQRTQLELAFSGMNMQLKASF